MIQLKKMTPTQATSHGSSVVEARVLRHRRKNSTHINQLAETVGGKIIEAFNDRNVRIIPKTTGELERDLRHAQRSLVCRRHIAVWLMWRCFRILNPVSKRKKRLKRLFTKLESGSAKMYAETALHLIPLVTGKTKPISYLAQSPTFYLKNTSLNHTRTCNFHSSTCKARSLPV